MDKEKIEKLHLSRFKQLIKNFPDGEITDSEEPDFVIDSDKKYGIELTMLFPKTDDLIPPQAQEIIKNKIAENSGKLYNKLDLTAPRKSRVACPRVG